MSLNIVEYDGRLSKAIGDWRLAIGDWRLATKSQYQSRGYTILFNERPGTPELRRAVENGIHVRCTRPPFYGRQISEIQGHHRGRSN
jgi:hypothetical protein